VLLLDLDPVHFAAHDHVLDCWMFGFETIGLLYSKRFGDVAEEMFCVRIVGLIHFMARCIRGDCAGVYLVLLGLGLVV